MVNQEAEAWFDRGCEQYEKGDFEGAIASYDKAIEFKSGYHEAWNNRGNALGNLGQIEEALASYDKAIEFNPDYYYAWYNRSSSLYDLGRIEEALASYDKTIKVKPDYHEAWYNWGIALGNLERFEEALASYDKAIEFKPDKHEAWNNRGIALGNLGQNEEALTSFDKAIEIKPDKHEAWNSRGVALGNLGQFKEALASFDKAIEIKPDKHEAWYNRGWALGNLGQFEEALTSCNKALEIKPDKHEAWYKRGWVLEKLGQFEEAIASFDKAIEFKPDKHEAWYNRGFALYNLGRNEEALASFDKAIKFKSGYHEAWNNRGGALYDLGKFEEAIASWDKAIEFKSDYHEAWNNRGVALYDLGKFEEAIASYDKAIEFKSDYHEAWNNRGFALYNLGQIEEAIASYNKAIKFKPDFQKAWHNRGIALYNLGQIEEAIASFDKAIEFKPDYHEAWNNRGLALDDLGRFEDALASFDRAIKFKTDYHTAWNSRGFALYNLGRFEDALASWTKAIEIKPDQYEAWVNRGSLLCDNLQRYEDAISSFDKAIEIKPDGHQAWINRGIAVGKSPAYILFSADLLQAQFPASPRVISNSNLNKRGYKGQLLTLEIGLHNFQLDTPDHKLGRGRLHQEIGNAHYFQKYNKTSGFSFFDFCNKAIASYDRALETLTQEDVPEAHLDVLQDYIKALLGLRRNDEATELKQQAKDLLRRLQDETHNPTQQKQLKIKLKLAIFDQLTVDILVQYEQWIEALETAEKGKNTCLSWLFSDESSPKYPEIQQLLNPATAAVYWHLSPYALHTFIIKSGESKPIVIDSETASLTRVDKFEEWVKKWNQEYAKGKGEKQEGGAQTWRDNLEETLKKLGKILNIATIEERVRGIKNLILIPHRDLHRFPIHALFGDEFIISYLPSAKLGLINKNDNHSHPINELLSVEAPNSKGFAELPLADLESAAIVQLFATSTRLNELDDNPEKPTFENLKAIIQQPHSIFHFTGHGVYDFNNPALSYLALTNSDKLTINDIINYDLSSYNLVTLSACETAVTANQTITTEYVGLVSGFISAGVSHVVSTLWSVESDACALVMMQFYRQLNKGKSKAVALAEAIKWVRTLTPKKLSRIYQVGLAKLPLNHRRVGPTLKREIRRLAKIEAQNDKLFEHPYHWAAFTITGRF